MIQLTSPTLETERLILRPVRLMDAPAVQRLAGDPGVARTTASIPHPYENWMAERWIARQRQACNEGRAVVFSMILRQNEQLIGIMSLDDIRWHHQAGMGYWVGVPYWGLGFCTEAGRAVIEYAFTALGLYRVHAQHLSSNPASGRVMQKLGMHHEGRRAGHACRWGRIEDVDLYGIINPASGNPGEEPGPAS